MIHINMLQTGYRWVWGDTATRPPNEFLNLGCQAFYLRWARWPRVAYVNPALMITGVQAPIGTTITPDEYVSAGTIHFTLDEGTK